MYINVDELCNILGVEAEISSITRFRKMLVNNIRPLRVCLCNEVNKRKIFTRSPQLRHNSKYIETCLHVYVNHNTTTAERESNMTTTEREST